MTEGFRCTVTALDGLLLVERPRLGDARGYFSRFFCADTFAALGFASPVAQINHTVTKRRGSIRGLHFQHPPAAEVKYVSCLRGEIWDVAVDIRCGSPTFLHWHAERLSEDNSRSLLIPQGFAHGFQTLTDDVELLYLHSSPYSPMSEGALNALDPRLAISWPLPVGSLSSRDAQHPFLDADFAGIEL